MACFEIAERSDRTTLIFISRPDLRQTEGLEKLQIEPRAISISWTAGDWYYTLTFQSHKKMLKKKMFTLLMEGWIQEFKNHLIYLAKIGISNIEKPAGILSERRILDW